MRSFKLALTGLLLAPAVYAQQPIPPIQSPPAAAQPPANAQPPAAQPPAANNPARLDQLLNRWEQEMKNIQTLTADLNRTMLDKTYQGTDVFTGTAKYMKPNLAMLELQKKSNAQVFEKYICSGTFLYEWVPGNKVIRAHELPPPKAGQVGDDNFLSFLFGMKAEEAKRRYDLKLVKEDQWYVYIEVLPRFPADKVDFQKARLVLNQSNFLPRQVWFEQPNGNEITWDIPKIQSGTQIKREDFAPPATLPQGWNIIRVPRADAAAPAGQPPRIVRPQQ
ncbi:MAG: TIGR03009 domain-containing protein [Gemmataceae bacterium]|nr:TIGR03009 domain-containing protein [Gemmataceae bacterium]